MNNITIVVPVHNAVDNLKGLLFDLSTTESGDIAKIFIDDASNEETTKLLKDFCLVDKNSSYLRNDKQQLFTRTVNRGIRAAQPDTDYYICINTDCELKTGWMFRLIEVAKKYTKLGIVGYYDGKPENGEGETECYYPSRPDYPDYVTGHCFLVPREAWEQVGLFCETDLQQAHIASERLWCWRAASLGYRMFYVNSDLCIHDSGGPSWKRDLNWLYSFNYSQLWPGKDTL